MSDKTENKKQRQRAYYIIDNAIKSDGTWKNGITSTDIQFLSGVIEDYEYCNKELASACKSMHDFIINNEWTLPKEIENLIRGLEL